MLVKTHSGVEGFHVIANFLRALFPMFDNMNKQLCHALLTVYCFFLCYLSFYNLCTTLANSAQQDNDQYHSDTIQVMLFFFFFFFDGTFPKSIGRKPGALLVSIASARLAAANFLLSLLLFVTGA